jgi:diadenylate cyclase
MPDFEHIRDILSRVGPADAVDISLLAVLIYAAVRLLSETRAMTPARGALLLVLVALLLGRAFDLTAVNFLVERSLPALLIALAIIFQPELRRGLDRLGRTGVRGWIDPERQSDTIDALVAAATRMAGDRHGGLFVFERATPLQDVIATGVPVDARVSPELLQGIFFPNSPLHDMAVVLRHERVVAAGCILPLASEWDGDRHVGTRHRAAIGITEHTDAFTIVVSEETGDISVGYAGRLIQVADGPRLRAVMETLLAPARDVARGTVGSAPL